MLSFRRLSRHFLYLSRYAALLLLALPAQAEPARFAVLNQHSVSVTAEIWNPILAEVSRSSGVPLVLAMGKTAPETTARTVAGEFEFAYTNHLFSPERDKLGWRVIARLNRPSIEGLVVVAAHSPLQKLSDLEGKTVVFPSREAFVAFQVIKPALQAAGIHVTERFAGNQESAMQQLKAGSADAAAVNDEVMRAFGLRENFAWRELWRSEPFPDLAVMAGPQVPAETVARVRGALLKLRDTAPGRAALDAANRVFKNPEPLAFVPATDADYDVYRHFWRQVPRAGQ